MSFLRHVGKMGDRKVAIIFREIPGEPHILNLGSTCGHGHTPHRWFYRRQISCLHQPCWSWL